MVIILCQCDNAPSMRYLQATAARHLHMRTLKLGNHFTMSGEHCYMKTISMTVSDQHIAIVTHVNTVGKICQILSSDLTQELAILVVNNNAMTLENIQILDTVCSFGLMALYLLCNGNNIAIAIVKTYGNGIIKFYTFILYTFFVLL